MVRSGEDEAENGARRDVRVALVLIGRDMSQRHFLLKCGSGRWCGGGI